CAPRWTPKSPIMSPLAIFSPSSLSAWSAGRGATTRDLFMMSVADAAPSCDAEQSRCQGNLPPDASVSGSLHTADQRGADRLDVPLKLTGAVDAGRPEQQSLDAEVGVAAGGVQVDLLARGDGDLQVAELGRSLDGPGQGADLPQHVASALHVHPRG